jgi:hypothetical protein
MSEVAIIGVVALVVGVFSIALYWIKSKKGFRAHIKAAPYMLQVRDQDRPPKEIDDELRLAVKKLREGYLVFVCAQNMTLGKPEVVYAEMFKETELLETLAENQRVEQIIVGSSMSVKLSGRDFEITTLNDQYQLILPQRKTKWQWDVVPLKYGIRAIRLSVAVKLKIDGIEEFYNYDILTKDIIVTISRTYIIAKFWQKNWQWIVSTILGSGVLIVILKAFGVLPK